ncbi:MAG TPA: hypothetical protein VN181_17000, partial [Thermoanaerobaculia bacterium]|nr:hypothetical protein [Thermoanaerobaculia bacterium]
MSIVAIPASAADSAQSSLQYLRSTMDAYHDRIGVYEDVSSPGNHFPVPAKIPDPSTHVTLDGSWTDNPHSGATSLRCEFKPSPGEFFGGYYFQNGAFSGTQTGPSANFGTVPNAGLDLSGATALTFWARGASGGEQIEFFVAGVGRDGQSGAPVTPYPDSSPRVPGVGTTTTLTTSWQKFTIDLTGRDLSYVLGGFAWVAAGAPATFFVDDIQYELSPARRAQRLEEPRFLRSYTTLPRQSDPLDANNDDDFDFTQRNVAFTYDNALALLAFLADGSADSIRRARLIGDAFVYASRHDAVFNDNRACDESIDPLTPDGARLRSAYAAGDLKLPPGWAPNNRPGAVTAPSFYVESRSTSYAVEQNAVDVGNNAWAMIALLALHQRTGEESYLDTACKLGNFIQAFRRDSGPYRGFTGGVRYEGESAQRQPWASSEHNLDVYAAFTTMERV